MNTDAGSEKKSYKAPELKRLSHYDMLGVGKNFDQSELKVAFRRSAKRYNADYNRAGGMTSEPGMSDRQRDASSLVMRGVNEAYQTLSNPKSRAKYDEELKVVEAKAEADRLESERKRNEQVKNDAERKAEMARQRKRQEDEEWRKGRVRESNDRLKDMGSDFGERAAGVFYTSEGRTRMANFLKIIEAESSNRLQILSWVDSNERLPEVVVVGAIYRHAAEGGWNTQRIDEARQEINDQIDLLRAARLFEMREEVSIGCDPRHNEVEFQRLKVYGQLRSYDFGFAVGWQKVADGFDPQTAVGLEGWFVPVKGEAITKQLSEITRQETILKSGRSMGEAIAKWQYTDQGKRRITEHLDRVARAEGRRLGWARRLSMGLLDQKQLLNRAEHAAQNLVHYSRIDMVSEYSGLRTQFGGTEYDIRDMERDLRQWQVGQQLEAKWRAGEDIRPVVPDLDEPEQLNLVRSESKWAKPGDRKIFETGFMEGWEKLAGQQPRKEK